MSMEAMLVSMARLYNKQMFETIPCTHVRIMLVVKLFDKMFLQNDCCHTII